MNVDELINYINAFDNGDIPYQFDSSEFHYENSCISVVKVESSGKRSDKGKNGLLTQWSIIFLPKNDFIMTCLPKYVELWSNIGNCKCNVTPVRTGKNKDKGWYGLRFYDMKRAPDDNIVKIILDFIFSDYV